MRNHGPDLPCFSYHGTFPAMKDCTVSDYAESHQGGVPLVIYNNSDPELPMTVFSPLNQPMAHQMASGFTHGIIESRAFFGAGIKVQPGTRKEWFNFMNKINIFLFLHQATVQNIPAGWNQMFILSAGKGINEGMMAWGDRMLRFTGKPRANMYRDSTHATIGFWTDNGG